MKPHQYLLIVSMMAATVASAADPMPKKWIDSTAYVIPKKTATDGEGYFSIIEGHNKRLYIGTHANAVNSWLVEFDPAAEKMRIAVDTHKAIGKDLKGFGSQAKIHTRNNTGKLTGRIYFGTKQGYPAKGEKREDYPGGYPMVYDPKTGKTKVYPIPVPHHGINSITPDESRGVAYISTCSDHRPGPGENAIFLILNLKTGKYRKLIDTEHYYGFIVVDYMGRAYHPLLGGDIARYDPRSGKLERLKQTIDGTPPANATRLALTDPHPDPINWDISPDGKTLYAQPMSGNALFAYDLTATGNTLPGRSLGALIPGAKSTDCRAMCVGPSGSAWCAITEKSEGVSLLHLVRYRTGDKSPVDLGAVAVRNPDFTEFTGKDGKALPFHGGFTKLKNGRTITRYAILGVCESKDGNVNILALHPYSVLQVRAADISATDSKAATQSRSDVTTINQRLRGARR
jgi:sugar lactone lactonase YvrE